MDFFEAQDLARKRTHVLVGLFLAAVLAIIVAVYLVVAVGGGMTMGPGPVFDPVLFLVVAFLTGILIGGGSLFRTAQLRKGGPAVAALLGGRKVDPHTTDPDERRLVNVVEEMSVASGTPVPAIFVLDNEESINAFAAGYSIHDAAVAVTRGTLETLDRDELQGVIAHEFSHILNGDMRLNIRLIGLLFGILLLAIVGRSFLYRGAIRGRGRGGDSRAAMLGIALVAVGYIGVFFGKLIKAAVSRQREYLADAAAVQFTRNPQGLAGALRKIGAHPRGGRIRDHHAEELSHLFFADGVGGALAMSMATHPPLEDRIRRVDPSWDGTFPEEPVRKPEAERARGREASRREAVGAGAGGRGTGVPGAEGPLGELTGPALAALLLQTVGDPAAEHVAYARRLLDAIPEELRDAAHEKQGAQALVLALLGGANEPSREARRTAAASLTGTGGEEGDAVVVDLAARTKALEAQVAELPPESRLPLVDLALPALHDLSPEEAGRLRSAVQQVARADRTIRPFDFAVIHILWRHLPGGRERRGDRGRDIRSIRTLRRDLETVLSVVARAGDRGEEAASAAFQAGVEALQGEVEPLRLRAEDVDLGQVDEALDRLERGSLEVRRRVLQACAAAVFADRAVDATEVELLRAVAECLELPVPPLLAGAPRP